MTQHLSRLSRGFEEVHFKVEGAGLCLKRVLIIESTSTPLVKTVVSNYLAFLPLQEVATLE